MQFRHVPFYRNGLQPQAANQPHSTNSDELYDTVDTHTRVADHCSVQRMIGVARAKGFYIC